VDLEFDVEKGGHMVAGEDLVEVGEVGEVPGAGVRNLNFADVRIVTDQGAAVGGATDIELEAVATVG